MSDHAINGISVSLPEGFSIAMAPGAGQKRSGVAPAATVDPLLAALKQQEIEVAATVPIAVSPSGPPLRRGTPVAPRAASVEVGLAAGEEAMVLVETNGFYQWRLPEETAAQPQALRKRGPTPLPATRVARFTIPLPSSPPSTPAPGPTRGFPQAAGAAIGFIKTYVLKFTARAAADGLVKWLERNVQPGLVRINSVSPEQWTRVENLAELKLPQNRRPRVLLLIHGTFSSTLGSYGGLGATVWGRAFLEGALASYDAVIGFDHATLGQDARENANDLWRRLNADSFAMQPVLDIVTFSRGGLVYRFFAEEMLPRLTPGPTIGRVVFVGSTLGGTELASAGNWEKLLDLYTSLAAGSARAASMLPNVSAQTVSAILTGSVTALGAFAKYLAATAITERRIPGLAAMEPEGEFVKWINQPQPSEPTAQSSWYAAVTSEFEPQALLALLDQGRPSELPRELLLWLGSGFIGQLFGDVANDLVVNTQSMTDIDPHNGDMFKDTLSFGKNPVVYHTNYFLQPATVNALARWLRLAAPPASATTAAEGPTAVIRSRGLRRIAPAPAALPVHGLAVPGELPALVDADILHLPSGTLAWQGIELLREKTPSYVVLDRKHEGQLLWYALDAEEVLRRVRDAQPPPEISMTEFLGLHEYEKSLTADAKEKPKPVSVAPGTVSTAARTVVMDGMRPVGVVPEQHGPYTMADLIDFQSITSRPETAEERVVYRRIVPSFTRTSVSMAAAEPTAKRRSAKSISPARPPKSELETAPPTPAMQVVPEAAPAISTATCHFRADAPEKCVLRQPASVNVTISREQLDDLAGRARADASGEVDLTRKITLQFVPKLNVEPEEGTATELDVDPPAPDAPVMRRFRFLPVHEGPGEIWIVVWQREEPMLTLKLRFDIVLPGTPVTPRRVSSEAAAAEVPRGIKPIDRLTIFEQQVGNQIAYRYEFDSPTLGRNWVCHSKAFQRDRGEFIQQIYDELEALWPAEGDRKVFAEKLQAYGVELLDNLMPPELQEVLWENRERIGSIQVFSEEPFVPWETVHLRPKNGDLPEDRTWFLGELGLVRWLHNMQLPPDTLRAREGRAFRLVPEYQHDGYKLPEAQNEIPFLTQKFKAIECPANLGDVHALLRGPDQFDFLHFAGHGEADQKKIGSSGLLVRADLNPADPNNAIVVSLEARVVSAIMRVNSAGADPTRPMVVLNACRAGRVGWSLTKLGGFAEAFLSRGAGLFIGAHWSIGDQPARIFTEAFYRGLLNGGTVAEAVIAARTEARNAGDTSWLAYTVYAHPYAVLKA